MKIKDSNKLTEPGKFKKFKIVIESEGEASLIIALLAQTSVKIEEQFGVGDIYKNLYRPMLDRIAPTRKIYPSFKELILD